ncbi:hypothetical protein A3731_18930 [Roseovarius sp. HI0049]|nr:hypothetical protein A3731_18930 [Roseovarius sp. HI0049]
MDMQRLSIAALTVLLAGSQPLLAQSTQQDIEAEESPTIEMPDSGVVDEEAADAEKRDPSDVGVETNFESSDTEPAPEAAAEPEADQAADLDLPGSARPSYEMLNDTRKLMDSIRSKTAQPDEPLSHLDNLTDVFILPLSKVKDEGNYEGPPMDEILAGKQDMVAEYRSQMANNQLVRLKLDEAGFSHEDVLTWETAGTAVATVVVDDR